MHCLETSDRTKNCITDNSWDSLRRSTPFKISKADWKAKSALGIYNARRTYYLEKSKYYTLYISILPILFLLFARYYSYKESHQTLLFSKDEESEMKEEEVEEVDEELNIESILSAFGGDSLALARIFSRKNTAAEFIKTMRGEGVNESMASDKSLEKFFDDTKKALGDTSLKKNLNSFFKV